MARRSRPSTAIFKKATLLQKADSAEIRRTNIYSSSILKARAESIERLNIEEPRTCQQSGASALYTELKVKNEQLTPHSHVIETAQKWLNLEGKNNRMHKFPLKTILPEVQMTRVVLKKHLPRDVEVERRRKQYAKINLEAEFEKAGLTASELMPTEEQYYILSENAFEHFLPLSFFDDSNYDTHSSTAWLKLGQIESGEFYPLPAKAFLPVNQRLMEVNNWQFAAIQSYDDDTGKWTAINLSDEHWEAVAWPRTIIERLSTLREEQKVDIEDFKRLHLSECIGFEERLESLNDEVQAFSLMFIPEKVLETANDIKKTWRTIKDLEKLGETLSYRQELFELEPLSLDFLNSIIESCTPYKNLWYSCLDLVKLEEATIGNPLANVEVDEVWKSLETIKESLEKSLIVFEEKPEIQDVATYFLAQWDMFIPKVRAIEDMKNENWLFLHWQELANRSGLDIKYSLAMNFQYLMRKGIMDHLDLVHEISVKAVDEADAIRLAMEEEERRKEEEQQALILRKAMRKCRTDIL
uniref:Dynein heavy chain linker domain-containing protein n=1 Tax=Glossina palpalis gambiensis TaxID=67801 RepID=A0A1B0BA35_9MUSC